MGNILHGPGSYLVSFGEELYTDTIFLRVLKLFLFTCHLKASKILEQTVADAEQYPQRILCSTSGDSLFSPHCIMRKV